MRQIVLFAQEKLFGQFAPIVRPLRIRNFLRLFQFQEGQLQSFVAREGPEAVFDKVSQSQDHRGGAGVIRLSRSEGVDRGKVSRASRPRERLVVFQRALDRQRPNPALSGGNEIQPSEQTVNGGIARARAFDYLATERGEETGCRLDTEFFLGGPFADLRGGSANS